jgi:signal transduction histidine kinase
MYRGTTLIVTAVVGATVFTGLLRSTVEGWVMHGSEVNQSLTNILLDVADLDAGKRVYVLTLDNEFLESFYRGRTELPRDIRKFVNLTRDSRAEQIRGEELESYASNLIAVSNEIVSERQHVGLEGAIKMVSLKEAKRLSDACRRTTLEALSDETNLMAGRLKTENSCELALACLIALLSLLALALGGLALEQMRRALDNEHMSAEHKFSQQRQDFMAALAHDLKIPAVAARNIYKLLLDGVVGELTPKQQQIVKALDESNEAQLDMICRLVQVYRYQSIKDSLALSEVNLSELSKDCLRKYEGRDDIASLSVVSESDDIGTSCDRLAIEMVLNNLLDNALKLTPKNGKVTVHLEKRGKSAILEVIDTGPGFSAQSQESMFEKFWQGPAEGQYSATIGLGLYLCKQIVDAHGGKIDCSSEPGKGATFKVTLPFKSVKARASHLRLVAPNSDADVSSTG